MGSVVILLLFKCADGKQIWKIISDTIQEIIVNNKTSIKVIQSEVISSFRFA